MVDAEPIVPLSNPLGKADTFQKAKGGGRVAPHGSRDDELATDESHRSVALTAVRWRARRRSESGEAFVNGPQRRLQPSKDSLVEIRVTLRPSRLRLNDAKATLEACDRGVEVRPKTCRDAAE
jgi:hypothetical protein